MLSLLRLSAGDLTLWLAPHLGGSIAAFRCADLDLMRPMSAVALEQGDSRRSACFPLVPYSNRIAHGAFGWEGGRFELDRTSADAVHAIHGNARHLNWQVADAGPGRAVLVLVHSANGDGAAGLRGWPWAFEVSQSFTLSPDVLRMTLVLRNRASTSMPAGLGWHPFFPRREETLLAFGAERVWRNGPDMLPERNDPASTVLGGAHPRSLSASDVDNCFAGWDGRVTIEYPRQGVEIELAGRSPLTHLVVYAPAGGDAFAVEPVSHMNDAVNGMSRAPGHGLRVLLPGREMQAEVTLKVRRNRRPSSAS